MPIREQIGNRDECYCGRPRYEHPAHALCDRPTPNPIAWLDFQREVDARRASQPDVDKFCALINARNDVMAAIVGLRGGHPSVLDDCDRAVAALDIAITRFASRRSVGEPPHGVPVSGQTRPEAGQDPKESDKVG